MTKKTLKNRPQKLLIIGPNHFFHCPAQTTDHSPQPTAQIWFFILWNLGTRHLFSYLCNRLLCLLWFPMHWTLFSIKLFLGCRFQWKKGVILWICSALQAVISFSAWDKSFLQCWTLGAIFTFGRSRMFDPDKLRPFVVGRSRSGRIKKCKTYVIKVLISNHSN